MNDDKEPPDTPGREIGQRAAESNSIDERVDLGHFKEVELPADAYGAAMYAFIYDTRELLSGKDHDSKPCWLNIYRLVYVLTVLMVNYLFQFLMLWWIFDFVVQPSVHGVQKTYARYHGEFFSEEGEFDRGRWDGRTEEWDIAFKHHLCHMAFPKYTFLCFVLMLWVMIMVIEFRKNVSLLLSVYSLPVCPRSHPERMIKGSGGGHDETEADDDKIFIEGLTPGIRTTIYLIILLPKFLIGILLCTLGLIWLSATESFSDLILNSLALEFVINVDDHLFEALLPLSYRENLGADGHVFMRIPVKPMDIDDMVAEDWAGWKSSTFFLLFIPVLCFGYLSYLQVLPVFGVLPNFDYDVGHACAAFLDRQKQRVCDNGFGKDDCFEFAGFDG